MKRGVVVWFSVGLLFILLGFVIVGFSSPSGHVVEETPDSGVMTFIKNLFSRDVEPVSKGESNTKTQAIKVEEDTSAMDSVLEGLQEDGETQNPSIVDFDCGRERKEGIIVSKTTQGVGKPFLNEFFYIIVEGPHVGGVFLREEVLAEAKSTCLDDLVKKGRNSLGFVSYVPFQCVNEKRCTAAIRNAGTKPDYDRDCSSYFKWESTPHSDTGVDYVCNERLVEGSVPYRVYSNQGEYFDNIADKHTFDCTCSFKENFITVLRYGCEECQEEL